MTPDLTTVESVTTRAGFESLARPWEELAAAPGGTDPFLSHEWHRCCIESDPEQPLHILVVRSGRSVIGIAPLWHRRVAIRSVVARALTFISSSETARSDFLVLDDAREVALSALLDYLTDAHRSGCDIVSLAQWPSDSRNRQGFDRLMTRARTRRFTHTTSVAPFISITGDWESYWNSRSYLFRKSRRGILNRLNRVGEARVTCLEGDRAKEALEVYRQVASRGWKHREGLSLTSRKATDRFFECLTEAAGRRGWLMVWVLYVKGTPVAVEYDLTSGGRVYALRADFDQEFGSHSPGAYLEYQIIKHLFENGYVEYSAGPGRDTYKARWTESERTNLTLTLCQATGRGQAIWILEGLVAPVLRRARDLLAVRSGASS